MQVIRDAEGVAFSGEIPEWAGPLLTHFHEEQAVLVTLNYDTVLERLAFLALSGASGEEKDEFKPAGTYPLHVTDIRTRQGRYYTRSVGDSFELLKLHGSINWFYPGTELSDSHEIYYRQVDSRSPARDCERRGGISAIAYRDLSPLIVPPLVEKSPFYAAGLLASLWVRFRYTLEKVEQLFIVGSSLPKTDVPLEVFLKAHSGNLKRVFLVDSAGGQAADALKERLREVFGKRKLDSTYIGEGTVERWATDLIGGEV